MKYLKLKRGAKTNIGTILGFNPKQHSGDTIFETAGWFVKLRGTDTGVWCKYSDIEPE